MIGKFRIYHLNDRLVRITDAAATHIYLVKGDREAALLDTGVGYGRLDECVRTLTDLPVKAIITHGHLDHAMGAGAFEDAWLSPLDRAVYEEHCAMDARLDYIRGTAPFGGLPEAAEVTAEMLEAPKPFELFHSLRPGDRFDLGGVTLEIGEGAGHTPGCVTVLIPELRTLLLGDACNSSTFLFDAFSSTVAEYREMLLRLKPAVAGKFDHVLICHGPDGRGAADLIDSVIAVCDDILRGEADNIPFQGFQGKSACIAKAVDFATFTRVDGGSGNVLYNPNRIR